VNDEQLTVEEFERVLRSKRFATVHDLVNATGFSELNAGSRRSESPDADVDGDADGSSLPERR
jgi:hypothetical protein